MGQVFISYSHKDVWIMRALKMKLEMNGISVWVDERIIPGEPSWRKAIERAILDSSCLIAIMTEDFRKSDWAGKELDYASAQDKPIFPILASGDARTPPFGYVTSQWIDVRPEPETDFDLSIENLIRHLTPHLRNTPIRWNYSANLFWLGNDLATSWSYFHLAHQTSKEKLLRFVRQTYHHANELNFTDLALALLNIYFDLKNTPDDALTPEKRMEFAYRLEPFIGKIGDLAKEYQPNVKLWSEVK